MPCLDAVLEGGIHELSLAVGAGPIASGETTLGQQFVGLLGGALSHDTQIRAIGSTGVGKTVLAGQFIWNRGDERCEFVVLPFGTEE